MRHERSDSVVFYVPLAFSLTVPAESAVSYPTKQNFVTRLHSCESAGTFKTREFKKERKK